MTKESIQDFHLCELYEQFPTKQSAIEYFEELRWGTRQAQFVR